MREISYLYRISCEWSEQVTILLVEYEYYEIICVNIKIYLFICDDWFMFNKLLVSIDIL